MMSNKLLNIKNLDNYRFYIPEVHVFFQGTKSTSNRVGRLVRFFEPVRTGPNIFVKKKKILKKKC